MQKLQILTKNLSGNIMNTQNNHLTRISANERAIDSF